MSNVYSRHYRVFRTQNNKDNPKCRKFLLKFIGFEFDDEYEEYFKRLFSVLDVIHVTKPKISVLGENPIDFPISALDIMSTVEIHFADSVTSDELKMLIYEAGNISMDNYSVTYLNEPVNHNIKDYQRIINQIEGKDEEYYPTVLGYEPDFINDKMINAKTEEIVGPALLTKVYNAMREKRIENENKMKKRVEKAIKTTNK